MRIFLLAGLLAAASACDKTCVIEIYTKVKGVADGAGGWTDGDLATYGYALYRGAVESKKGGGTVAAGFKFVDDVFGYVGAACGSTRAGVAKCITDATDANVTEIEGKITASTPATNHPYYKEILGLIANQLAPGSKPAKKWTGLTAAQYETALKVYYIVGAFGSTVIPAIDSAYASDSTKKDACYAQLDTAVGYTSGGDLANLIATKGALLFGATGLGHASCFGTGSTAATATVGTTTYATPALALAATDAKIKAADADVARVKTVGQPTAPPAASAKSPAAALSAAIAAVALMF